MRKRTAVILLLLVLIGAAVNFPVAMMCDTSLSGASGVPQTINVFGAVAATKQWPTPTPHGRAWPAPKQWSESRRFGYSRIDVWSWAPSGTGGVGGLAQFQMDAAFVGWPLPCVRRVRMYWPWSDPAWQTTAEPDPKPSVYWLGALLNPVIFGVGVWLALVAPFELFIAGRRRSRRRRGACQGCGYPVGSAAVCTECGAALREAARGRGANDRAHG